MRLISPVFYPWWLKPLAALLATAPLLWLLARGVLGTLGANPVETVIRFLGDWALILLLVTLAVTPVRRLTGWAAVMRLRRMLGLFAFAYAVLHLLVYFGLDLGLDPAALWADVLRRRFITVGMVAFGILFVLAVTSWPRLIRALGGQRWKRLHRLVYGAAVLGVVHYFWMIKAGYARPLMFAGILALLLGVRLAWTTAEAWTAGRRPQPVPKG